MTTKRKTAANRRNARRSTGPKTPAGKAASSMNALRHGLRARTVVLHDENQEEFDQLFAGLQDLYQPQNAAEQHLVDQAVIAQWMLVRAEVYQAKSAKESPSAEARIAVFSRMTLVTGRLDRAYHKAYHELERIKAAREKQPDQSDHQSKQPEPDQSKQPDQPPSKVNLVWLDRVTGKRDFLCKLENGKAVDHFSHESPEPPKPPTEPL
jgi:hypothetical protein